MIYIAEKLLIGVEQQLLTLVNYKAHNFQHWMMPQDNRNKRQYLAYDYKIAIIQSEILKLSCEMRALPDLNNIKNIYKRRIYTSFL